MSVDNIQAQEAAKFYLTEYPAEQFVRVGRYEGLLPVFSAVQTTVGSPSELSPTATFDLTQAGAIDLRGADGFALEFLGVPGSTANETFTVSVQLVIPVYATRGGAPVAFRYQQVYFSSTGQLNSAASQTPGALDGLFGITSSHRYVVNGMAAASAPLLFAQVPNTTSQRAVVHIYAAGAPYALVTLRRNNAAATHPTDLQALYRLFVVNEARTSVVSG